METPAIASAPDTASDITLGTAEQACKECRRRKSKCNRAIPACDLCIKYRRHCLYEKHARTPLTRRHLTEVEEKLERSRAIIAQLRSLVPPHLRSGSLASSTPAPGTIRDEQGDNIDFNTLPSPGVPSASETLGPDLTSTPAIHSTIRSPRRDDTYSSAHAGRRISYEANHMDPMLDPPRDRRHGRVGEPGPDVLEASPEDDFEWDEQEVDTTNHPSASPDDGTENPEDGAESVADGMASLAVNERKSGYLGVASGAALLRLFEPTASSTTTTTTPRPRSQSTVPRAAAANPTRENRYYPLHLQPDPTRHITDLMIDAYFSQYHLSYPIIHEATFRAQYSGVIPRPHGDCWLVLAYMVAAIGVWTTSTTTLDDLDADLFVRARSTLSFNFLEVGNITLVQALTLVSNYQQKRNKPNSGYNYLGLALRVAMGLGLHKEFEGWKISPLSMEVRRRVWWSLCVFEVGATITFSRPSTWPREGVEVALPLNVDDRALTALSKSYPPQTDGITPYTAVRTQASFHEATTSIYTRVISKPAPSAKELLDLDDSLIRSWTASITPCFRYDAVVPLRYHHAHSVMRWRLLNFRIIMYRPFVIRAVLHARANGGGPVEQVSADDMRAYEICLRQAKETIADIKESISQVEPNRLQAWYALYFLFQATLIPSICFRSDIASPTSTDLQDQILAALETISALAPQNASAARCYQAITGMCGQFLRGPLPPAPESKPSPVAARCGGGGGGGGVGAMGNAVGEELRDLEERQQLNPLMDLDDGSLIWPGATADEPFMGDETWMHFLRGEGDGWWSGG